MRFFGRIFRLRFGCLKSFKKRISTLDAQLRPIIAIASDITGVGLACEVILHEHLGEFVTPLFHVRRKCYEVSWDWYLVLIANLDERRRVRRHVDNGLEVYLLARRNEYWFSHCYKIKMAGTHTSRYAPLPRYSSLMTHNLQLIHIVREAAAHTHQASVLAVEHIRAAVAHILEHTATIAVTEQGVSLPSLQLSDAVDGLADTFHGDSWKRLAVVRLHEQSDIVALVGDDYVRASVNADAVAAFHRHEAMPEHTTLRFGGREIIAEDGVDDLREIGWRRADIKEIHIRFV